MKVTRAIRTKVAYTLLTLVIRVGALDAPAAGVDMTRAIRTLGFVILRPSALGRGVCWCRRISIIGHGIVPPQVGFFGYFRNQ